jgi:hypothetical protein
VLEDACGASLEARWLSRQTDPQGRPISSPRASLPSFSGVQSYPSIPVRSGSGTLLSEPHSQRAVVRSLPFAETVEQTVPRRRRWPLVLGAAVAVVAIGAGIVFATRSEPSRAIVSSASVPVSPVSSPAPVSPPVSVAPIPVPVAASAELQGGASPPRRLSKGSGPSKPLPAPSASPAPLVTPVKPAPASDLISPY